MRLSVLFLLPALVSAFAPVRPQIRTYSTRLMENAVADTCEDVVSKTEDALGKADEYVLSRALRFVNHAPVLVTLGGFAKAAGSSKYGVDAAASTFKYASPAGLALPVWLGYAWPVICVAQIASVLKSSLASDGDELSQRDISVLAVANVAATRALTSATPLRWLAATSVISGYPARNGGDGDVTIHNAALQLMSSFTGAMTVLGAAARLPDVIPFLAGQAEITAGIGLAAYYVLATRKNNGTVKRLVNAGIIGGILASKIAGGALKLTASNLLSVGTLVTAGTAFVAVEAIRRAKDALA